MNKIWKVFNIVVFEEEAALEFLFLPQYPTVIKGELRTIYENIEAKPFIAEHTNFIRKLKVVI